VHPAVQWDTSDAAAGQAAQVNVPEHLGHNGNADGPCCCGRTQPRYVRCVCQQLLLLLPLRGKVRGNPLAAAVAAGGVMRRGVVARSSRTRAGWLRRGAHQLRAPAAMVFSRSRHGGSVLQPPHERS
jgi:hypothetical protein